MHLEIPIDKKELRKLGDGLPQGGINELVRRTKFKQSFISRFFHGDYNVTENNKILIDEARAIIIEQLKKASEIAREINETINR